VPKILVHTVANFDLYAWSLFHVVLWKFC